MDDHDLHHAVFDFPDLLSVSADDVVAVGGNLSVGTLRNAYSKGIFPWPHEDHPLLWFFPQQRGLIHRHDFRQPRSLKKLLKHKNYLFQWNSHFAQVIHECQQLPRKNQSGTWITDAMKDGYLEFHRAGYAKCLTVHHPQTQQLIGGIYGVYCRHIFSAESMFFHESNASKAALSALCEFLFFSGVGFVDVQMVTDTSAQFGATYLEAAEYQKLLKAHQAPNKNLEKLWSEYLSSAV